MNFNIDFSAFGKNLGEDLIKFAKEQLEEGKELGVELANRLKNYGERVALAYQLVLSGNKSGLLIEIIDDLQVAAKGVLVQAELKAFNHLKETLKGALAILLQSIVTLSKALVL